ncbi:hydrocephalus-inducing protein-like, partial [Hirundo rustica]|uniref:hydrocephalus-inducing protein-like n=1 Tax=Hirundo rustica TaxID=43150 RepID=UPI001A947202
PFSVVPATGTLGAGDTMQVTVGFHPLTAGDHSGSLVVCCTGEESICTNLQGKAEDVNIELNTNFVKVEKTFVNMSKHTTMFIKNSSNITAHFQWKAFPTEEHENEEKRRQCSLLQPSAKVWLEAYKKDKKMEKEKGFCENRALLLCNKYKQDNAKVQADPMLFSNDIFFIEPMEGEIGPHCLAEIKVTFKPLEAREYRCVAYCNISGRESRLPLCLRGEGQGPLVELCSDTLNLGSLSANTPHNCEVKLINKGLLDAPFTYIPSITNVGSCFKFAPEEGILAPGEIQTIQISFNATVLGYFDEQFQFSVAGSPTPVILTIKGRVHRPTLHFDVDELDFGDISFGFPFTRLCRLTNTSLVPVTFKLRVSDDGTQPAVSSFDQIRSDSDPSWREGLHSSVKPREFTMNPSQGTILPQGHQDIEVTLCPNTVTEFCRKLLVDLEEIGEGVASLVLQARCFVPKLQVYPPILCIDDSCLKVPFKRKFFMRNNTHLPGCYGLIPQERKEDSPVFYSSPKPCGIVQPHSTAEIPIVVEAQTLGKHRTRAPIGVFGDERNPLGIELQSYGKLSEIYPSPRLIEFGMIPVLQPNSQNFILFNEGLVPKYFRMKIVCKPHCYVIEPREGVIPADGAVPVTITATLDDTGVFDDVIQLFIGNSLWSILMLQALGVGCTIVIDKPFTPELNLGYQFSVLPCIHRFRLTNRGHHFHRLFWKVECNSPAEEEGQSTSALSSPEAKDDSQSPKRTRPVFGLEPPSMDLQPGESVDMVLQGFSRVPQVVRDYVRCEAVIGTGSVTKNIIETIITCEFIDPSIEVSPRQFSFRVVKPHLPQRTPDTLQLQ